MNDLETTRPCAEAKGWMLVPVEPTEEMLNSGAKFSLSLRDAYVDMLRAAPTVPDEPVAWLKTKGDRRRVDLFPDLDSWMTHDKGWAVTPLYAAPSGQAKPVAWRVWARGDRKSSRGVYEYPTADDFRIWKVDGCEVEPLYTTPPESAKTDFAREGDAIYEEIVRTIVDRVDRGTVGPNQEIVITIGQDLIRRLSRHLLGMPPRIVPLPQCET